jgi:hypothetical protein
MGDFKVGDVCEIIDSPLHGYGDKPYVGREVVISGPLEFRTRLMREAHRISGLGNGFEYAIPEVLRLKRPPSEYDGNKAGDWDLIPWSPNKAKERA